MSRRVWVVMLRGGEPVGVYVDEDAAKAAAAYWWGYGAYVVPYVPAKENDDGE